jgi:predicted unusual protein kinase regulating ubiquinone biosynthesis (AarF/ABC1/UbiB family)
MTGALPTESLGEDVAAFVASVADRPLGSLRMGATLRDLVGVLHRHRLTLPPTMTMLAKAAFEFESTTEELHADLVLSDVVPLALGLGVPAGPLTVQAA